MKVIPSSDGFSSCNKIIPQNICNSAERESIIFAKQKKAARMSRTPIYTA